MVPANPGALGERGTLAEIVGRRHGRRGWGARLTPAHCHSARFSLRGLDGALSGSGSTNAWALLAGATTGAPLYTVLVVVIAHEYGAYDFEPMSLGRMDCH